MRNTLNQFRKQKREISKAMSDTTTEDYSEESNWVPYSERPDWSDVTPLEQDDGQAAVVKIAYSARCKLKMLRVTDVF